MGEFDKELDDYLSGRNRNSITGFVKNIFGKKKNVEVPEEVEVYQTEKKSLFSKVFHKEHKEPEYEHSDETIEDMKEIAKIALIAIKQLPDETLSTFKKGRDFEKLKDILKKYKLIK